MRPDPEIVEYFSLIPRGPAIDLGVGEGRNAFFLASRGFEALGIDSSEEAVKKCKKEASKRGLPLRAVVADARDFPIDENRYACIVCSYLLPFLKYSEALSLAERIKRGLMSGGIVFVRTFTTKDPSYEKLRKRGLLEVEKNTFFSPKFGMHFFYLEPGELRELFSDLELVSYAEGYSLDITHDQPHYHGWASLVARKP